MIPREEMARKTARTLRKNLQIKTFPVDLYRIYNLKDWDLVWCCNDIGGKTDGVTIHYDGFYRTCLPKKAQAQASTRLRFTLAHEIGHILLGHFRDFNLTIINKDYIGRSTIWVLNREANYFAEELLMPEEFIKSNISNGIQWLKCTCGVSQEALKARFDTLGMQKVYQLQLTTATRNDLKILNESRF